MKTPRWMPRSTIALAAAALGTAGLRLAMVPSFAQESKPPPSEVPATPVPDADLEEGGDAATVPGPVSNGPREIGDRIENVAADLTLESARIESLNLNDTDQEYAVYQFGRVVHEVRDVHGFTLRPSRRCGADRLCLLEEAVAGRTGLRAVLDPKPGMCRVVMLPKSWARKQ